MVIRTCINHFELADYASGLDLADERNIEEHLEEGCEPCTDRLSEIREFLKHGYPCA